MNYIKKNWKSRALLALLAAGVPYVAAAGSVATNAPADATELSLDQLINIQVTSVSKKATPLENSPAAISVITADDISRLGITSVPEALRLVPGMDVAQINANEWAVSVRGFNGEFADKLLVLVDGRSVYSPSTGGVYWNAQNLMMEDLDRIEVIRGPGATLWGANAVDGVVNIVSKSARDTQGLLLTGAGGSEVQPIAGVRYGGQLGSNVFFRVYAQQSDYADFAETTGKSSSDFWDTSLGGFRLDWEPPTPNVLTVQGDFYDDDAATPTQAVSLSPPGISSITNLDHNSGGNLLGRWTHDFSAAAQLSLQAYYDHMEQAVGFGPLYQNTFDVQLQQRFTLGSRNDFVVGTGYRDTSVGEGATFNAIMTPETAYERIFNLFAQDDITAVPDRLHFLLGSKLEHDSLVGWEPQPSARITWTPTDKQTVWGAISRSTGTPPFYALDSRINFDAFPTGPGASPPGLVSLFPNSNLVPEKMLAYEMGYRVEPVKQLSFDAAAFYNVYDDLLITVANPNSFEVNPAPPHVLISQSWQSAGAADTYGFELSGQWHPVDYWRLVASYSLLKEDQHVFSPNNGEDPQQQFQLRSYLDLTSRLQLNAALYFVDSATYTSTLGPTRVPAYGRADIGLVWHPRRWLEMGIWGENLLKDKHVEFPSQEAPVEVEVPRSVLAKVTMRF